MPAGRRLGAPAESQAELAYRAIHRLVLASREHEGSVWFERQLVADLGLGRTPVREALKRLQAEGLLVPVSAHGGLAAATISNAEVGDVYRVRAALEALAAEQAAQRSAAGELPPAALAELRGRAQLIKERAADGDLVGVSQTNQAFHQHIVALAGNGLLRDTLDQLWSRIAISAMSNVVDDPHWLAETHRHHDELTELIIAGHAEAAAALARVHIDRAREVYQDHHTSPDPA